MNGIDGKDYVDLMAEAINHRVKDRIRDVLVEKHVEEFRKTITEEVENSLADMVFNAASYKECQHFRDDLRVLIKWVKLKEDRPTVEYELQRKFTDE